MSHGTNSVGWTQQLSSTGPIRMYQTGNDTACECNTDPTSNGVSTIQVNPVTNERTEYVGCENWNGEMLWGSDLDGAPLPFDGPGKTNPFCYVKQTCTGSKASGKFPGAHYICPCEAPSLQGVTTAKNIMQAQHDTMKLDVEKTGKGEGIKLFVVDAFHTEALKGFLGGMTYTMHSAPGCEGNWQPGVATHGSFMAMQTKADFIINTYQKWTGVATKVDLHLVQATSEGMGFIECGYAGILLALENGADVITNSWGGSSTSSASIAGYVGLLAKDMGVVLAASGGNDPSVTAAHFPGGSEPMIISVGAGNEYGVMPYWATRHSNFRPLFNETFYNPDIIPAAGAVQRAGFSYEWCAPGDVCDNVEREVVYPVGAWTRGTVRFNQTNADVDEFVLLEGVTGSVQTSAAIEYENHMSYDWIQANQQYLGNYMSYGYSVASHQTTYDAEQSAMTTMSGMTTRGYKNAQNVYLTVPVAAGTGRAAAVDMAVGVETADGGSNSLYPNCTQGGYDIVQVTAMTPNGEVLLRDVNHPYNVECAAAAGSTYLPAGYAGLKSRFTFNAILPDDATAITVRLLSDIGISTADLGESYFGFKLYSVSLPSQTMAAANLAQYSVSTWSYTQVGYTWWSTARQQGEILTFKIPTDVPPGSPLRIVVRMLKQGGVSGIDPVTGYVNYINIVGVSVTDYTPIPGNTPVYNTLPYSVVKTMKLTAWGGGSSAACQVFGGIAATLKGDTGWSAEDVRGAILSTGTTSGSYDSAQTHGVIDYAAARQALATSKDSAKSTFQAADCCENFDCTTLPFGMDADSYACEYEHQCTQSVAKCTNLTRHIRPTFMIHPSRRQDIINTWFASPSTPPSPPAPPQSPGGTAPSPCDPVPTPTCNGYNVVKKQVCCTVLDSGTGMRCAITLKNAGTETAVGYSNGYHFDRINGVGFITSQTVTVVSGQVGVYDAYGGYIYYPVLGAEAEVAFVIDINVDGPHTYIVDNDDDNAGGECDETDNQFTLQVAA